MAYFPTQFLSFVSGVPFPISSPRVYHATIGMSTDCGSHLTSRFKRLRPSSFRSLTASLLFAASPLECSATYRLDLIYRVRFAGERVANREFDGIELKPC